MCSDKNGANGAIATDSSCTAACKGAVGSDLVAGHTFTPELANALGQGDLARGVFEGTLSVEEPYYYQ